MPAFEERARCGAPAVEVWKLLYDPERFPAWWAGMDRVETCADGRVVRYMSEWPDFAYPTAVTSRAEDGRVVISCLLSDIAHTWTLEPAPEGCAVRVRVELPEEEAVRLEPLRDETRASLARLVALAERGGEP